MRYRVMIAVASLMLPATLSAQRVPGRGMPPRPWPTDPQPLSPQPEPIARAIQYQRMRVSVESYPAISFVTTSGLTGPGASSWTAFGAGTRVDYRLTRLVSATLDLTSSLAGGPVLVHSAELGTRIRAEPSERRLEPFADVRVGYVATTSGDLRFGGNAAYSARYSEGWGAMAGAGFEYGLTRTFSLTTALMATRSSMTAHDFQSTFASNPTFSLTTIRYTLGLRYNPVRTVYR